MPLYISLTLPIVHEQRPARLHVKFYRQSLTNRLPSHNWKKCLVATWRPYKKVNFRPWGLIAWGKSILFLGKWKWWSGGQVKLAPILLVQSKAISYLKSDSKMSKTMQYFSPGTTENWNVLTYMYLATRFHIFPCPGICQVLDAVWSWRALQKPKLFLAATWTNVSFSLQTVA